MERILKKSDIRSSFLSRGTSYFLIRCNLLNFEESCLFFTVELFSLTLCDKLIIKLVDFSSINFANFSTKSSVAFSKSTFQE